MRGNFVDVGVECLLEVDHEFEHLAIRHQSLNEPPFCCVAQPMGLVQCFVPGLVCLHCLSLPVTRVHLDFVDSLHRELILSGIVQMYLDLTEHPRLPSILGSFLGLHQT